MKKSGTPLIRALERFSEQVSDGLVEGKRRLCQLPVVGSTFSKIFKKLPLQSGHVTHIIITSLSYARMYHTQHHYPLELRGTKFDFALLLRHFDYRHEGNSVNFTLLNDFDVDFTDSTGAQRVIPKADTSRDSIRRTIQSIMRTAERDAKILFFFGGHGEYAEVNMEGGDSEDDCDFQTIIAGDGRRIYVTELRSWFCDARYPSISVTAIFDACCSGGSLGLPYSYGVKGSKVSVDKASRIRISIPMVGYPAANLANAQVQISATQTNQAAWSNTYNDGYYGQFTHSLVQYLKENTRTTIEGLVDHLSKKCDPSGAQLPQVCCSLKLKGRFSLFNLPV